MSQLLEGVKVVALVHYLQGPACAQYVADMGADVVKVEKIGGGYERHWSGAESYAEDESVFFLLAGRNQRSIELDFRSKAGAKILWRLVEEADVLIQNFRPGVLERYGFSYEAVRAKNPSIIHCSLSGFGSEGPMSKRPGQDLLIQSLSGLASLTGGAEMPPTPVGTSIVDLHAASLGAMGILAALVRRGRTGEGAKVDSNLLSAALDLQIEPFNYHLNGTNLYPRSPSGISTRFHQAPYGVFQTADGWITLSLSDGATLAQVFDDPKLEGWSKADQFIRREEINAIVAIHILSRNTSEWMTLFETAGLWYAPIRDYDEVASDPQVAANGSILEFMHPRAGSVRVLGHPVKYDGEALGIRILPPDAGQHTTEVLGALGYTPDEIDYLRHIGVVGPALEEEKFRS